MRVAVAAMLLALLSPSAVAADGSGASSPASTPASAALGSTSSANASSTKESSATTSAAPTGSALVASEVAPAAIAEPAPTTALVASPTAATAPALDSSFVNTNSLGPIHALAALAAPPAAFIKLKQQPRSHSFFDARNTLGFATLGASLTADALSTQKGLAYPGFVEMNPIARPFVQTRTGAAVYNAGSFGLMAGLMYWAHKTEHHKLERILPLAIGSWEGLLSARNYHVIASRPR